MFFFSFQKTAIPFSSLALLPVHDALCVLSQTAATEAKRTVLGGGASEGLMARAVDELAATTAGKQALAIDAFARALRAIPTVLVRRRASSHSRLSLAVVRFCCAQ